MSESGVLAGEGRVMEPQATDHEIRGQREKERKKRERNEAAAHDRVCGSKAVYCCQ